MNKTAVRWTLFTGLLVFTTTPIVHAESAEIEQLRKEYEQQIDTMRESFDKRLKCKRQLRSDTV